MPISSLRLTLLAHAPLAVDLLGRDIFERLCVAILEMQCRYDALVQRYETVKNKLDMTQETVDKKHAQRLMMENFMETLKSLPKQVDFFDEGTWYALCDPITVYSKDDIRVTFQNGMEIKVRK